MSTFTWLQTSSCKYCRDFFQIQHPLPASIVKLGKDHIIEENQEQMPIKQYALKTIKQMQ